MLCVTSDASDGNRGLPSAAFEFLPNLPAEYSERVSEEKKPGFEEDGTDFYKDEQGAADHDEDEGDVEATDWEPCVDQIIAGTGVLGVHLRAV